MKKQITLLTLLAAACVPQETRPIDPFGEAFLRASEVIMKGTISSLIWQKPGLFLLAATSPITVPLFSVISLVTGIKIITTLYTRHDYARNFIKSPERIESYSITARALSRTRKKMRWNIVDEQLFTGKEFETLAKQCGEWKSSVSSDLTITVQPAIRLVSHKTYNLKRLRFAPKKYTPLELQQELVDLFYIPPRNNSTYIKKTFLWSIPFSISTGLLYGILRALR